MLRRFVDWQIRLSKRFDRLLPERYWATESFRRDIVPRYLSAGATIYDIGAGSSPCIDPETKKRLRLHVVGLDIDVDELRRAPAEAYCETIVSDICRFQGNGDADLVLCHASLEHVRCTSSAFAQCPPS